MNDSSVGSNYAKTNKSVEEENGEITSSNDKSPSSSMVDGSGKSTKTMEHK